MKNIKRRLTALGLVLPILVGSCAWCMTKPQKKRNGYSIETSNEETNGLYSYIIDTANLESKNHKLEDLALNYANINYAKVIESVEYGTYFYNDKDENFYGKHLRLALPSSYEDSYDANILLSNDFDQAIIYEKVKCLQDLEFTIVYSAATAKRDVAPTKEGKNKTTFNVGDKLYSTAIYYQDEIVGYKQYGVGSECEDIAYLAIGNVDQALKSVQLNEMTPMSYEGLKAIEEELNGASARSRNLK